MRHRTRGVSLAVGVVALLGSAATASANPIKMPTILQQLEKQQREAPAYKAFNPPAPPCPAYPTISCNPVPETPAAGLPFPGNMAYWGGHVQTHPREYIVYWGWGEPGAFKNSAGIPTNCSSETFTEGTLSATLACDPEGTGKYMADFVEQLGGTDWSGVASQYYQSNSAGTQTPISNDLHQLAGIWVDDTNSAAPMATSNATNPAGSTNTYTLMAQEAARAVQHFGITDLADANIIIAQPPAFSDPNALSQGYCAFHDYTLPDVESGIYNGITQGISYTNMPYVNAIDSGGANVCAEDSVNPPPKGTDDAFSIVLGHEIMETTTDPGAEDITTDSSGNQTFYGGWYDTVDANENGDKCAYVGYSPLAGLAGPNVLPIPGALGNITGNAGGIFAVQSTWSNGAFGGLGYCDGVNPPPGPLAGPYGAPVNNPQPVSTTTTGSGSAKGHKGKGAKTKGAKTRSSKGSKVKATPRRSRHVSRV